MHTVWNGTESANTALDCSNYNGSKIITYNTFLDNRQLQDAQVSTLTAVVPVPDDYRENQKYCDNSCILNRKVYALNWFKHTEPKSIYIY